MSENNNHYNPNRSPDVFNRTDGTYNGFPADYPIIGHLNFDEETQSGSPIIGGYSNHRRSFVSVYETQKDSHGSKKNNENGSQVETIKKVKKIKKRRKNGKNPPKYCGKDDTIFKKKSSDDDKGNNYRGNNKYSGNLVHQGVYTRSQIEEINSI